MSDPGGPQLAARRYLLLVGQLGDELKRKYGWKSKVARRLGVDASYVQKMAEGDRVSVGLDAIERAIGELKLRREFFYDPTLGASPNYRDHILNAESRVEPDIVADLQAYLDAREAAGRPVPPSRRAKLMTCAGWAKADDRTARWWERMDTILDMQFGDELTLATVQVQDEMERRAAARGAKKLPRPAMPEPPPEPDSPPRKRR